MSQQSGTVTPAGPSKADDATANEKFVKEMRASKLRTKVQKKKEEAVNKYNQQIGRTVALSMDKEQVNKQAAANKEVEQKQDDDPTNDIFKTKKKVFDPFACPPDLDMAITHLKASRIALEEAKANSSITRLLNLEDQTEAPETAKQPEVNTFTSNSSKDWEANVEKFVFKTESERNFIGMPKGDRVSDSDLNEYCPCCNYLVKTKVVALKDGIEGIKNLGVGFSLYFKFNYELMITTILVSLVAIYMTVRNTLGTMCILNAKTYPGSSSIVGCEAGWITKVSISNYGLTTQDTVEKGLYFLMAVIVYGFSIFWYASLHAQAEEIDALQDSPEDWTVLIKNIDYPHTQTMYIDKSLNLEIPDLDDYVKLLIENLDRGLHQEEKDSTKPPTSANQIQPVNKSKKVDQAEAGESRDQSKFTINNPEENQPLVKTRTNQLSAEQQSQSAGQTDPPSAAPAKRGKYLVEDTNYVYKCKELVDLDKKLTEAKQDIRRMLMSEPATLDDKANLDLLEKLNPKKNKDAAYSLGQEHFDTSGFSMDFQVKFIQAQFLNTKLLELIKEMKDARRRYYLGWVFVTFQTEDMRDDFIDQFNSNKDKTQDKRFIAPVVKLWRTITCSTEVGIEVNKAPNPEDIIWENLGTPAKERGKHIVISYGVTFLVLGMNFGLTLLFNYLKFTYSDKLGTTLSVGLSAVLAIFNNIFDQILTLTINFFTEWENHETRTELKNSILIKIFFTQFVNTNLLTLISYVIIFGTKAQAIHQEGGILSDVVSIIISQLLVNPALVLVNPPFIIGFVKQYLMQLRVHYSLALSVTQQNAHDTFQYPEIGVSEMYSESLKPMMTAFFFLPMMPAGAFAAVGSALLVQYANLFRLLRTSATPKPAGPEIAYTSLYLMNLAPLFLAIGQLIFESIFRGESLGGNSTFAWIFFGVTLFFSFVPVYPFFKDLECSKKLYIPVLKFFDQVNAILSCKCKGNTGNISEYGNESGPLIPDQKEKTKNYLNFYNVLNTDYKTQNPVTEDEGVKAREAFLELIKFINEYKSMINEMLVMPLSQLPHPDLAGKFALISDPTQRVRIIKNLFPTIQEFYETVHYTDTLQNLQAQNYVFKSDKPENQWVNLRNDYFFRLTGRDLPPFNQPEPKVKSNKPPKNKSKEPSLQDYLTKKNFKPVTEKEMCGQAIINLEEELKKNVSSANKDVTTASRRINAIKDFYNAVKWICKHPNELGKPKGDGPESTKIDVDVAAPQTLENAKLVAAKSGELSDSKKPKEHELWAAFIACNSKKKEKKENDQKKNSVAILQAIQDAKKRQKLANKINYTRFLELLKNFDQKALEDTFGSKLAKYHYNQTALNANTQQLVALNEMQIVKKMFA